MLCANLTREQSCELYKATLAEPDPVKRNRQCRALCEQDLFFLLTVACRRKDVNRDWLYHRVREYEADPYGHLDLWAREHYKSTIITFGKTIQDLLVNPEITVGIFSHTKGIAKGFLKQIMRELEQNEWLKELFPDVLHEHPRKQAVQWSVDEGIIVKRDSKPKEASVEAHGLTDGQPTSKHFSDMVYDDVVTLESVSTPEQIDKVTSAWALSLNLGASGGRRRYIGTRYHYNDTYRVIIEREAAIPRVYPATEDGTVNGEPVFLTRMELDEKRRAMGPYVYASQMLLDPKEDSVMGFSEDWLRYYDRLSNTSGWNFYIVVDPANEKKKTNDYTVIAVIGAAPDNNLYLVDGLRDRLNLQERTDALFKFHRKWRPLNTGYEKYGIQSDIQHIEYVMEQQNYRFKLTAVGGSMPKNDRIRRLVPVFEAGRFWLPHTLYFLDHEKQTKDFIREFIKDEYHAFPVAVHDDMLDCLSRIMEKDLDVRFPEPLNLKRPSITMEGDHDKVQTEYDIFETSAH